MAISSDFYVDLSKFEPTFGQGTMTKRQVKILVKIVPLSIMIVGVFVLIPGILGYLLCSALASVLLGPLLLKFTGHWSSVVHSYKFFMTVKERRYQIRPHNPERREE